MVSWDLGFKYHYTYNCVHQTLSLGIAYAVFVLKINYWLPKSSRSGSLSYMLLLCALRFFYWGY